MLKRAPILLRLGTFCSWLLRYPLSLSATWDFDQAEIAETVAYPAVPVSL